MIVFLAILILTLGLLYPLVMLEPEEQASPNPPGEVYDLQAMIDDKFPSPVHFATFVIEAKEGDVLTASVLRELNKNKHILLNMDYREELNAGTLPKQSYLFSYYEDSLGDTVTGLSSIVDFLPFV